MDKIIYVYIIHVLTSLIVRMNGIYSSFLVRFSKFCGNCTNATSWPFSSSIKQQSASLMAMELFEYMSQSTFRMTFPLLIFEETLICIKPINGNFSKLIK